MFCPDHLVLKEGILPLAYRNRSKPLAKSMDTVSEYKLKELRAKDVGWKEWQCKLFVHWYCEEMSVSFWSTVTTGTSKVIEKGGGDNLIWFDSSWSHKGWAIKGNWLIFLKFSKSSVVTSGEWVVLVCYFGSSNTAAQTTYEISQSTWNKEITFSWAHPISFPWCPRVSSILEYLIL